MRKLWELTAYLARFQPGYLEQIRATIDNLDALRERELEPVRRARELVAAGERDAALAVLDRFLDPSPCEAFVPQTRARPLQCRR